MLCYGLQHDNQLTEEAAKRCRNVFIFTAVAIDICDFKGEDALLSLAPLNEIVVNLLT